MANAAKKAKPQAKRGQTKKTTKKAPAKKVDAKRQKQAPAAKTEPTVEPTPVVEAKDGQNEVKGAMKERFVATKDLIVDGLVSAKNFVVNCFNGALDFIKGLFNGFMDFMKGLFSKEQWKDKTGFFKNVFNVIAIGAGVCILGQLTVAAFGWTGLLIGSAGLTVTCYGINRLTMEEDERETAGPISIKNALLPSLG